MILTKEYDCQKKEYAADKYKHKRERERERERERNTQEILYWFLPQLRVV
jgi:hypothetical protein